MKEKLVLAALLAALPLASSAAPLGTPALDPGVDIRSETGEITLPAFNGGAAVTVVRYTWRDSAGRPRSVALLPAGATTGYAVQMTYQVVDGAPRTVFVNADNSNGDGGFGYFVSHELFREFTDGSVTTIAAKQGVDDSPLGKGLASTGSASSVTAQQAVHEFRHNYTRWGTQDAFTDPQANNGNKIPAAGPFLQFTLPVTIRWSFVAGFDHPLWSVAYAQPAGSTDRIAQDVRGPYGVMRFNEGNGPDVTALRWGDKYNFVADAGGADMGASTNDPMELGWTWNTVNDGRRYNVLGAGSYEFGIVDTVARANSRYADGYSESRNRTSNTWVSCMYGQRSLPCDFEWAYQSFQYDAGPPARPKLAWGSSPFLGTSLTQVWNGIENIPLQGTGTIAYNVHIVMGRAGAGTPLTLARSAAPIEANSTLSVPVPAPSGGVVVAHALGQPVPGTTATQYSFAPWTSVRVIAAPSPGRTFLGWTGACAGEPSNECLLAMDQSKTVGANFSAATPGALDIAPTGTDFGTHSAGTRSEARTFTVTNTTGGAVTISAITGSYLGAYDLLPGTTCQSQSQLAAGASCNLVVAFRSTMSGEDLNESVPYNREITLIHSGAGGSVTATLSAVGEKSFVRHYYRAVLGREPDAGGQSFWQGEAARMQQLGANLNEAWFAMATTFFNSGEYLAFGRSNAAFVTDLYRTFFNREPDAGGLQFWTGNMAQGMPRSVVLVAFSLSPEFREFSQAVFGNTAVRPEIDTVTDFYRGALARLPDSVGFAFWRDRFRTAQCQGVPFVNAEADQISSAFFASGEYSARARSDADFVGDLYNAFLRRGGDLDGVNYWISQVPVRGREGVRVAFRDSPEFANRTGAIAAAGCVN